MVVRGFGLVVLLALVTSSMQAQDTQTPQVKRRDNLIRRRFRFRSPCTGEKQREHRSMMHRMLRTADR